MPKVMSYRSAFNAGEFSILVEGRTDIDRYAASMRQMRNFIGVPQGPALRRPGLRLIGYGKSNDIAGKPTKLIPFTVDEDNSVDLEFSDFKMRVHQKTGVLTHPSTLVINVVDDSPFTVTSVGHGASIGDSVILNGFQPAYNNDGVPMPVINVAGNDVTVTGMPVGAPIGAPPPTVTMHRVYEATSPYGGTQVKRIRALQDVGDLYLFHDVHQPYIMTRAGTYDYKIEKITFENGPYMPVDPNYGTLTLGGTGNPIPDMTAANAPSGVASASTEAAGFEAWKAFDNSLDTYYESDNNQSAWLMYQFPAPRVINGYTIYIARINNDVTYSGRDYAPGTWDFQGSNDGVTFTTLDSQYAYSVYDNGRSVHFKFQNKTAYTYYRLNISEAMRNGELHIRIARLTMTDADTTGSGPNLVNATLGTPHDSFNGGLGFLATDVGRLIRFKGADNVWRQARITAYSSSTLVTVLLTDEPLLTTAVILEWQPGFYGETLGWPTCGEFVDDRLWMAGTQAIPDLIVASRTGAYGLTTDLGQRAPDNTVLDDSALVFRVKSRRLSRVHWLKYDERGVLWGSSSAEGIISGTGDEAITARNLRARSSTSRGSAPFVEAMKVDKAVLFIQNSGRTLREFAYNYEADGFRAPSMSLFASHLGVPKFIDIAYMSEPYSLILLIREDGSLVTVAYNREENVVGWHLHSFTGTIESMSVTLDPVTRQDSALFSVIRNGKRFLERWTPFWDFGQTLNNSVYLDHAVRYVGTATTDFYGLRNIPDGGLIDVLADGHIWEDIEVNNGQFTIPVAAANVLAGVRYESYAEIARIDAGGQNGTSMGKAKFANQVHIHLWDSYGGDVGKVVKSYGNGRPEFTPIQYPESYEITEEGLTLISGIIEKAVDMPNGWDKDATIHIRHDKPTPFNVVALTVEMNVGASGS